MLSLHCHYVIIVIIVTIFVIIVIILNISGDGNPVAEAVACVDVDMQICRYTQMWIDIAKCRCVDITKCGYVYANVDRYTQL